MQPPQPAPGHAESVLTFFEKRGQYLANTVHNFSDHIFFNLARTSPKNFHIRNFSKYAWFTKLRTPLELYFDISDLGKVN